MNIPFYTVLIYIAIMSLISFAMFGIDKYKAIKNRWRIKEKTLLLFSFLGGAFGSLFAMMLFRHKIRKPKFFILVPLFLVLHIIGVYYLFQLLFV